MVCFIGKKPINSAKQKDKSKFVVYYARLVTKSVTFDVFYKDILI